MGGGGVLSFLWSVFAYAESPCALCIHPSQLLMKCGKNKQLLACCSWSTSLSWSLCSSTRRSDLSSHSPGRQLDMSSPVTTWTERFSRLLVTRSKYSLLSSAAPKSSLLSGECKAHLVFGEKCSSLSPAERTWIGTFFLCWTWLE